MITQFRKKKPKFTTELIVVGKFHNRMGTVESHKGLQGNLEVRGDLLEDR